MDRIVIALLLVFAVATQSPWLEFNRDGIGRPAVAMQSSIGLPAFANGDDNDQSYVSGRIARAMDAVDPLVPLVQLPRLGQTQSLDLYGAPLYKLHAVWRI